MIKSEVNAACPPPTNTMFDGHAWMKTYKQSEGLVFVEGSTGVRQMSM